MRQSPALVEKVQLPSEQQEMNYEFEELKRLKNFDQVKKHAEKEKTEITDTE